MHSDEMEDITEAASGEICAMFGVDCYSGDTFTDGSHQLVMTSMHVPTPVMSLAIEPKDRATTAQFSKVHIIILNRFAGVMSIPFTGSEQVHQGRPDVQGRVRQRDQADHHQRHGRAAP